MAIRDGSWPLVRAQEWDSFVQRSGGYLASDLAAPSFRRKSTCDRVGHPTMPGREEGLRFDRLGHCRKPAVFPRCPAFFESIAAVMFCSLLAATSHAQRTQHDAVSIVEPGAPGTPSRQLPPTT